MNPVARSYPRDYLETGISAIDSLMTLIRGQKLPIFSGNGLPHNELAAQIVRQASVKGEESNFAIVFGAMGIKHDDADVVVLVLLFKQVFNEIGADKTCCARD